MGFSFFVMRYWLLGGVYLAVFVVKAQPAGEVATAVAAGVSMIAYKGELSSYASFGSMFHVRLMQTRHRWVYPAIEIGGGKLVANNARFAAESGNPNLSFHTSFLQLGLQLQLNVIKKTHQRLYLSQGIGLMRFNPKDDFGKTLLAQSATRAVDETYSNFSLLLPTALGGVYHFANQLGIGMEVGLLNTRTDYLDNISQLGNPADKDNVLGIQFSLFAPISYDTPERQAQRKEQLAKKRQEIQLKKQRAKEEFQQLKNKSKSKKVPPKKAPPKKIPQKRPASKKPALKQKKPKILGIF
ncbi:MAG: hypothetical protein RMJ44_07635 [Cytophagales bacterium]|nr:CCDC34 family protein [Bernardetiaceae bacterium]MDW8210946.1 hypothetical protein [Cytophagales bacterium]